MGTGATTGGERGHHAAVAAWCRRVEAVRSVEARVRAFEAAFFALWQRSQLTLGEVTLTAIVERVIHNASEQFPMVSSLEVGSSGLRCERLRSQTDLREDQVLTALEFVLVEFLTVLGNLTAEILTPALHAELASQDQAR